MLNTIREVFAHNLRTLRGSRQLKEVAGAAGIPYRTYQNMENGVIPQEATLQKIALVLGVPQTSLFLDPDLSSPTAEQIADVLSAALQNESFREQLAVLLRSYMTVIARKK